MLNPVECFIEGIQTNQEVLVQEVQQFLEFGQILQQDQKKILNDPIVLLSYAYQLEEYLGKQKQQVSEKILNILYVQLVLFSKFVQLNRSELGEYYFIFEVLQKKMKLVRFSSTNEDILGLSLDASRILYQSIDHKKLNSLSLMLYHINVYEYDEQDDIEVFYERLIQLKDKRQKLLNQENLLTYALNLLIQKCYRRVVNADKMDVALKVCLLLKEFKQFNNQLNLCILLAYYKMNMIEDFIEYSKALDQKTMSMDIQILHLVVRCKQLVKNESDLDKQKDIHQRMSSQFMELNLIHQVTDILMICKELASNLDTYVLAIRTISIWLQYKYNLIQKSSNAQNIQKMVHEINDLLEQCSTVLDHQFEEFPLIANMVVCQLLDLTYIIISIVGHFKKLYKISTNQFISFVVAQMPKFSDLQDKHIQHSAGKLISLLSTSQLEVTQNIQALSIYLNMEFKHLPQTQSILFQQILKDYKGGFITAVLLFIREFQNNQLPNERMNLCNQLRNLLEQANQIFEQNPIPMYALFEACIQVECVYHIQTAMKFIMKQQLNQELVKFTLKLMQKTDEFNSEEIFNSINKYLTSKTQDQVILQEMFQLTLLKPKKAEKSLCSLYCYFMIQMQMDTCSLQFIKDTIMGNNQFKYQWKSENNKSIFLFLVEICELSKESLPRVLLELLFYLIETNTREEVNQLIPYVLRLVIKLNIEEFSLKALQQSIKYDNLFSLLIVEVAQQKQCKQVLKKFIYEIQIPSMAYLQVLCHLIEISQTIDEVSELLPQLNQILRTTIIDENLAPYAQILYISFQIRYLKLNSLHEYVPLGRIDMFTQSLSLLQTKL